MMRKTHGMTDLVDLSIEGGDWVFDQLTDIAHTSFAAVLTDQNLSPEWKISLLACDDKRIATLNADHRGKPTATNVLSWPAFELAPNTAGEQPAHPPDPTDFADTLGDIAIAFETCMAEAKAAKITFSDHLTHLLIHSCLHLLGYDHETQQDAALMEGLETKILEKMGIADPYYQSA